MIEITVSTTEQTLTLLNAILTNSHIPKKITQSQNSATVVWEFANKATQPQENKKFPESYVILRISREEISESPISPDTTPRGANVELSHCPADDFLRPDRRRLPHYSVRAVNGLDASASTRALAFARALQWSRRLCEDRHLLENMLPKIPALDLGKIRNTFQEPTESEACLKEFRGILSEIVANSVFVSGALGATDAKRLENHGITRIVNLVTSLVPNEVESIEYLALNVRDAKDEDIVAFFPTVFEFIERERERRKPVLIHCVEGVSRSAAVAVGYIMWKNKYTFERALEVVRRARPIVNPNAGFTCQLLAYQERLLREGGAVSIDYRLSDRGGVKVLTTVTEATHVGVKRRGSHFTVLWQNAEDKNVMADLIKKLCWSEKAEVFHIEVAEVPVGPESRETFRIQLEPATLRSPRTCDNTQDIELYQWPDLEESLGLFDSHDLDSNSVFLLKFGGAFRVMWVGRDAVEFQKVINQFPDAEVVHEGQETQAFWDLFVNG